MSMSKEIDDWMAKQGIQVIAVPCKMTRKQALVWNHAKTHGQITLTEAVQLVGIEIYCNQSKHVGAIISNMVRRGMLKRLKPGVFTP